MSFDRDRIRKLAEEEKTVAAGELLFAQGKVKLLGVDRFWRGEQIFRLEVEDGAETCPVSLQLCGGEIGHMTCGCGGEQTARERMCRHLAAAAFYVWEEEKRREAPVVSTSEELRALLGNFGNRRLARRLAESSGLTFRLIPGLYWRTGTVSLGLWLESGGRREEVRDLENFALALEKGVPFFCGTGQEEIFLSKERFSGEDAALAFAVCGAVSGETGAPRGTEKSRLTLAGETLDRIADCLNGRTVETEADGVRLGERSFRDGTADGRRKLPLTVERAGRSGIALRCPERVRTAEGGRCFCLLIGDAVLRMDGAFKEGAGRFLQALEKSGARQEMFIRESDMPAFYSFYRQELESVFETEFRDVTIGDYCPQPFTAEFDVDSPAAGELTLRVRYRYGETEISPFDRVIRPELRRDAEKEKLIAALIRRYFRTRYAGRECFVIQGDDDRLYRFLDRGVRELSEQGNVVLAESVRNLRILPAPRVSLGVVDRGDWFDLRVDAEGLTPEELREALERYRQKKPYLHLNSGEFLRLDNREMSALAELYGSLDGEPEDGSRLVIPAWRALYVEGLREKMGAALTGPERFDRLIRSLQNAPETEKEPPRELSGVMKEYQRQGFAWMKTLDELGFGGILADEMGLGKTLQAISLMLDAAEKEKNAISLIVCPASLVYNWKHELEIYAPQLCCMTAAGNSPERGRTIAGAASSAETSPHPVQVLITSYDLLRRDIARYRDIRFRYCFLDEAQYIKNHLTQNAKTVKLIRARTRFALTGTPIENRLSELWSIMDFLMPGLLYGYARFSREIEQPAVRDQDPGAMDRLRRLIGPFVLRRLKRDVLRELPDKLETVIYSRMEGEQRRLYAANALALRSRLTGTDEERYRKERMQVLAELTRLRQICCDPALCYENYAGGSAKLETCIDLIRSSIRDGHRILLFSQYTSMLERIGVRLKEAQIHYYELTGRTGKRERAELADRFNRGEAPVFLISLKAGGTGLNLTAADTVIHYDPWWNVAAQNQATDRAHRLGQKNVVSVFRLITRSTVEENILLLQENKRRLAEKMLEASEGSGPAVSREDLLALLEERRMEDEFY